MSCVHVMYLTGLFPCRPININTSQGVTADLPQLSVNDSCRPLMSEDLSKANHNNKVIKTVEEIKKAGVKMLRDKE